MSKDFYNSKIQDYKNAIHDLNNLMHNIINGIGLLKDQINFKKEFFPLINNIEQNSLLASGIISQLSNREKISKTKVDLNKIISEVIKLFNNNIELDIANDNCFALGDYIQLKKVLVNLITNSLQAGDEKTKIKITLSFINIYKSQQSKFIRIKISDNAKGIHQDVIAKIFDKGFTSKSDLGNNGLGLFIVKNIVEEHNGWIDVKSSPGNGTTFSLFFPAYEKELNQDSINGKKVLIAEDDKFQREVLKDLLRSLKVEVFTASNGSEAFELFVNEKPDVIFLDQFMPIMSGIECTKKIKDVDSTSQIVLVTGSDIDDKTTKGNISRILHKPYNFERLKETLYQLL